MSPQNDQSLVDEAVPVRPVEESSPNPATRPPYNPPQYLLTSTGLSRDELLAQHEAFSQSVEHIGVAPDLVFERMVVNLKDVFNGALYQQYGHHAAAQEAWQHEKAALQADLDRALAAAKQPEKVSTPTCAISAAENLPMTASSNQTYLQFWNSYSTEYSPPSQYNPQQQLSERNYPQQPRNPRIHAHVAATTTPVPYGLIGSWPGMQYIREAADYGSYDTRMDALITATTLPTSVTRTVAFKKPFTTPPAVMVWLTGLCAASGAAVFVHVTANKVSETEFMLEISSGVDTRLVSVGVAWAVWSETKADSQGGGNQGGGQGGGGQGGGWSGARENSQVAARVGSASTVAQGEARVPKLDGSGKVPWQGRVVLVALCALDLVLGEALWMNVKMNGLNWSMSAGPVDAMLYSARVTYASLQE